MFIVRPITLDELDALHCFANMASLGITSLPKNRDLLEKKIALSLSSFSKEVAAPGHELYFFVAEEKKSGKIAGVSAILARQGVDEPCYYYSVKTVSAPQPLHTLQPIWITAGPTELCSLYLDPEIRHGGIGRLLSLSRFLFIAAHPHRFEKTIIAELRGYFDHTGRSPFWEGVGRHFYDRDFLAVMKELEKGKGFIPSILPHYPIYIELLPKDVQESIGKVHENTRPAYNILTTQGFTPTQHVDIFDGGPKVQTERDSLRAIATSKRMKVVSVVPIDETREKCIASNDKVDFRACNASVLTVNEQELHLDDNAARGLQVQPGDFIRVYPIEERHEKPLH